MKAICTTFSIKHLDRILKFNLKFKIAFEG